MLLLRAFLFKIKLLTNIFSVSANFLNAAKRFHGKSVGNEQVVHVTLNTASLLPPVPLKEIRSILGYEGYCVVLGRALKSLQFHKY